MLVTDTSIWAAFFRGEECHLLEQGLKAGNIGVPALVKLEVLSSPAGNREKKSLAELMASLPTLGLDDLHITRAAQLREKCFRRGLNVSARDCHVLQCALDQKGILLARSPRFADIERICGTQTLK